MYSVVLMAALSTSPAVPDFGGHRGYGCCGCYGGYGYACSGYHGGYGYGCSGCYGGYGSGYSAGGYYSYPAPGTQTPMPQGEKIPAPTMPQGEKIPAPKADGSKDEARADFTVDLPAGAKLFVDGQATEARAPTQTFTSPVLAAGQVYAYTFRAEVVRDGQTRSDTRRVVFRPGETVRVDFPGLTTAGTQTAQADKR